MEYFDRFSEANGDTCLVVTSIVTDLQYFAQPFVTTTHFKKIPDASGWDPTPVPGGSTTIALLRR